jgi:hypothetical protein
MAGKSNRKHGRHKRSPAMANYKAQSRDLVNAKRRAAKQLKLRAELRLSAKRREILRKQGALNRINRRLADPECNKSPEARSRLLAIHVKCQRAVLAAEAA